MFKIFTGQITNWDDPQITRDYGHPLPDLPIIPVIHTKAKGRTLSTYLTFALCSGQQQMSGLGYAPLPANLVKGGLLQVANIPGHVQAQCPSTRGS